MSKDDVDHRARWKMNQIQHRYTDIELNWPENTRSIDFSHQCIGPNLILSVYSVGLARAACGNSRNQEASAGDPRCNWTREAIEEKDHGRGGDVTPRPRE